MCENQYVVFSLENEEYAIEILKVCEINRLKEITITKIPKVPSFIDGIINLRGDVIPVINLRKKMDISQKELTKKSRIVIIKIDKQAVGLLVDSVSCVETFDSIHIASPPEKVKMKHEYIIGVGKKEERMIFIFDIDKILHTQ